MRHLAQSVSLLLLFLMPSQADVFDAADAVFPFNGDAKSKVGSMAGVENFASGQGYLAYSVNDSENFVATFNGQSFIEFPDLAQLDTFNGLTIALRFRVDGKSCAILSQRGRPDQRVFQIEVLSSESENTLGWIISRSKKDLELKIPNISSEEWINAIFVFSPQNFASIYLDGKRVAHSEDHIPAALNIRPETPWLLGAQPFPDSIKPSNFLKGNIDAMAVWTRPLEESEIQEVSSKLQKGF